MTSWVWTSALVWAATPAASGSVEKSSAAQLRAVLVDLDVVLDIVLDVVLDIVQSLTRVRVIKRRGGEATERGLGRAGLYQYASTTEQGATFRSTALRSVSLASGRSPGLQVITVVVPTGIKSHRLPIRCSARR